MFVCICHAVSEDEVHTAVREGALSIDDVCARTEAGLSCGSCHDILEETITRACAGTCVRTTLTATPLVGAHH